MARYNAIGRLGQARPGRTGLLSALLLLWLVVPGCGRKADRAVPAPDLPADPSRLTNPAPPRKPFETIKPH